MANPQIEEGYTKIANELLMALTRSNLQGSEFMICLAVLSKTYGWNKKHDQISLSQFQKLTGMYKGRCIRAIKHLVSYSVLGSTVGNTTTSSTYWIIKDYDKWNIPSIAHGTSIVHRTSPSTTGDKKVVLRTVPTQYTIQKTVKERGFTPPTIQDVQVYCQERNNGINSQRWHDFYTGKGWMIGKNKMKDWKAAVRTWENKDKPKTTAPDLV